MKKITLYEPAMCCPTGICGVGIDADLLRMSAVLNDLEKNGITVERFNLTNTPQAFVANQKINQLLMNHGMEILPMIMINDEIVKTGGYLSNDEIERLLNVTLEGLEKKRASEKKASPFNITTGCCSGDDCC
jgi:hypothetical protein